VLPMAPVELKRLPKFMIVNLLNSPYNVPQLKNAVFIGAFGYRLYSYIERGTKEDICCEICSTNISCQPHNNDYVLVKAKYSRISWSECCLSSRIWNENDI